MKIKIHYRKDSSLSTWPYWAETEIGGQSLLACGASFESAKERLMLMVTDYKENTGGGVPTDEEVEI